MKLVVIGAGIAGSSAARIARHMGWSVEIIDPNPETAASRCALATIRPTWFDKAGQAAANRSWEWYKMWGAAITQQATVTNWRNLEPKIQKDWWLVEPINVLVKPTINTQVTEIRGTSAKLADGTTITGDALINCTGAGSPLSVSHTPIAGATLVGEGQIDAKLRVHHIRPYHVLTVGQVGNTIRLGSSINKSLDAAVTEIWKMKDLAEQIGIVTPGINWNLVTGFRARRPGNNPALPQPGQTSTELGALARSGYALAPDAIHNWLTTL